MQSQGFAFQIEDCVRSLWFDIGKASSNNTNVFDVQSNELTEEMREKYGNISIKTTGSDSIDCGDLLRFISYDLNNPVTIVVVMYDQDDDYKNITRLIAIRYTEKMRKELLGNLSLGELQSYVAHVKSIPTNVGGEKAKAIFDYLNKKPNENANQAKILISPKVDTSQSRVQCRINKFTNTLAEFIIYDSCNPEQSDHHLNLPNGKKFIEKVKSGRRLRGGVKIRDLKCECKNKGIKGYSKASKAELIDMLKGFP